jgi:hypothetical protein
MTAGGRCVKPTRVVFPPGAVDGNRGQDGIRDGDAAVDRQQADGWRVGLAVENVQVVGRSKEARGATPEVQHGLRGHTPRPSQDACQIAAAESRVVTGVLAVPGQIRGVLKTPGPRQDIADSIREAELLDATGPHSRAAERAAAWLTPPCLSTLGAPWNTL